MNCVYQYIKFVEGTPSTKSKTWHCLNIHHGAQLGMIRWYGPWRRYCFTPTNQSWYSEGCLEDIRDFLKQVNEEQKMERAASKKPEQS